MNYLGSVEVGVKGRQNLQVLCKGELVRETGFHHNMVLDSWFTKLMTMVTGMDSPNGQAVAVGTGSLAVNPTQTNLSNFLAAKTGVDSKLATNLTETTDHLNYRVTRTWTFNEGGVVGNISETMTYVGQGNTPVSSTVGHTRALVLDVGGNPTTITVGVGEQLRVVHQIDLAVAKAVVSSNFNLTTAGNTTNHLIEIKFINKNDNKADALLFPGSTVTAFRPNSAYQNYTFGLNNGASTVGGANASLSGPTPVFSLVTPTKLRITSSIPSTQGNVTGGIGGFEIGSGSPIGVKCTPSIPKNSNNKWNFAYDLEFTRL